MATPAPQSLPLPTWTLEEVIVVLKKLSPLDLAHFLKSTYPKEALDSWSHEALLKTSLDLIQAWGKKAKWSDQFLIFATSTLCKASFEAFVRLLWEEVPIARPLMWNWHMKIFCAEASYCASYIYKGEAPPYNLLINVSPVTSKSTIFSVLFPCWVWTRMPKAVFITASHAETLAIDMAVYSRDVMRGDMYNLLFPYIRFTESQDAKSHYRNTEGGYRIICTVGGKAPIGKHANFVIVDDPLTVSNMRSEIEKEVAGDFIPKTLSTRRHRGAKGSPIVIMGVMQRMGFGDPSDVWETISKREGATPLRRVCFPAEITEDVTPVEFRKYYEGWNVDGGCAAEGLMDPIRLSRKELKRAYAELGAADYAGQYLQRPIPLEGGMFKEHWFDRRVRSAPFNCRRIRYWDRASATTESACFTAGVLIAYDGERFYVEDVVHGKWEPDQRNDIMLDTAIGDRRRYGKYQPIIYVEAEGGSTGKDAWLGVVRKLVGYHVREDRVQGSKDVRAEPWATQLSAGNVMIVDNGEKDQLGKAGWDVRGYIEEHLAFRKELGKRLGRFKDQVDASTGAFNLLIGRKREYLPLLTYEIRAKKNVGRWLVACSLAEMRSLDLSDHRVLVVVFSDPEVSQRIIIDNEGGEIVDAEMNSSLSPPSSNKEEHARVETSVAGSPGVDGVDNSHQIVPVRAPLSYLKHLGTLDLQFADLDPADYQVDYGEPIEPWGKPIADLQLSREDAKKFWAFVLKKYDPSWNVLILVDQGGEDGRALSAAMAAADMLRIPRSAIHLPSAHSKDEMVEDDPPNEWVLDQLKGAKHLVVS